MSGVLDENGQQWEHCNVCGEFRRIGDLGHIPGVCDICMECTNAYVDVITIVVPAHSWTAQYKE